MDSYAEAQAAQRAGDTKAARQLLLKAAELESKAFDSIPEGRSKTRGIVAVSAVSLYVEAGEAKQASRLAARFLHEADLSEEHRRELIDLLVDVERRARATLRGVASSQLFDVSLRGATVGIGGVIPLETVLLK